jgi:hypothetical protein
MLFTGKGVVTPERWGDEAGGFMEFKIIQKKMLSRVKYTSNPIDIIRFK